MRVIITGGTGLIGQHLTQNLLDDGHEVIVLTRNPDSYTGDVPSGTKLVKWDAKTAAGWAEYADGCDAIVNLAGAGIADKRWSDSRKQVIRESRLNAGKAVVAAVDAVTVKPRVVIQISGVGYYGPQDGSEKLTEEAPPGNDFPAEVCQNWWEPSTAEVEEMGVRRVIFRTGVVFSDSGGALERMTLPFQFFIGGPLGDGRQWVSWVHIEDVVRALRYAIDNETIEGVYNLTSPAPVRNRTVAQKIGTAMQRPDLIPAPAFAIRLLFGEMADVVLTGQRVVPQRLLESGFQFRYVEAETALRDLLANQ